MMETKHLYRDTSQQSSWPAANRPVLSPDETTVKSNTNQLTRCSSCTGQAEHRAQPSHPCRRHGHGSNVLDLGHDPSRDAGLYCWHCSNRRRGCTQNIFLHHFHSPDKKPAASVVNAQNGLQRKNHNHDNYTNSTVNVYIPHS